MDEQSPTCPRLAARKIMSDGEAGLERAHAHLPDEQSEPVQSAIPPSSEASSHLIGISQFTTLQARPVDWAIGASHSSPSRRRALTYPLPNPETAFSAVPLGAHTQSERLQSTSEQTHSILFRLPFEIRRLVWRYVLGGNMFHFTFQRRSTSAIIVEKCPHELANLKVWRSRADYCCKSDYSGKELIGLALTGVPKNPDLSVSLLRLPLTCRRVYSESIGTLYAENVFDFWAWVDVIAFSCSILPKRFHSIRKVRLMCEKRFNQPCEKGVDDPYGAYSTTGRLTKAQRFSLAWDRIASIESLRELYIQIEVLSSNLSSSTMDPALLLREQMPELFLSQYQLTRLSTFVVLIRDHRETWSYRRSITEVYQLPDTAFTIEYHKPRKAWK